MTSSSLLIDFSLKSNFLDISIATTTCFLGPFDWKTFSQPLILRHSLSLKLRDDTFMPQKDGFCLLIYSVNLCGFICELRTLILRNINVH